MNPGRRRPLAPRTRDVSVPTSLETRVGVTVTIIILYTTRFKKEIHIYIYRFIYIYTYIYIYVVVRSFVSPGVLLVHQHGFLKKRNKFEIVVWRCVKCALDLFWPSPLPMASR